MSDTADTEPNNNSFSITNAHTDSSLSPDQDLANPRVRDGPGRKCLQNTEFNKQWSTTHTEDYTVCIHFWFYISLPISFFFSFSKVTNCLPSSVTWEHPQCLVIMCVISKKRAGMLIKMCVIYLHFHFVHVSITLIVDGLIAESIVCC